MKSSIIVSGIDNTVRERIFKSAVQKLQSMVILDFNHENTDLYDYLISCCRKVITVLPVSDFSTEGVCNTIYQISKDEKQYHEARAALLLLEDVIKALDNTVLTRERYSALSEPTGFDKAMDTLRFRGVDTDNFIARYSRYAAIFNDIDVILDIASSGPPDPDTVYYIKPARANDTVENKLLMRQINASITASKAPITLVINEGLVNHGEDVLGLIRNCADSSNISILYFTRNIFAAPCGRDVLSYFANKVFSRNSIEAAQDVSSYFGSHEVREAKISTTHDNRIHAYTLPDRIFHRDSTTTKSVDTRTKPVVEAKRIAGLPNGVVVISSAAGLTIGSIGVIERRLIL